MRKLKHRANEAIRHGAAWFTVAGLSGGVCVWAVFEVVRKALATL